MDVKLIRAGVDDAEKLWKMQVEAFQGLYEKYQDTETSPAAEKVEKILMRFNQPFTYYYFIKAGNKDVGAIRIVVQYELLIGKKPVSRKEYPLFSLCRNIEIKVMHKRQYN